MKLRLLTLAMLYPPLAMLPAWAEDKDSKTDPAEFMAMETSPVQTQNLPSLEQQRKEVMEQMRLMNNQLKLLETQIKEARKNSRSSVIKPLYTKRVGESEYGFNHSNPTWTTDGNYLGFERHDERSKEILITDSDGSLLQTVKYQSQEEDDLGLGLLLPEFADNVSYNSGLSWSPDNQKFVFMSNGSEGNYDLYLGTLGTPDSVRVTMSNEKDGHAHWSPISEHIAFISGRSGSANIYVLNTLNNQTTQISNSSESYLYPQWSPAGGQLAVISGSNENHNIFVYDDVLGKPKARALVNWQYDDLRPIWSPDGKKIAFYTNYNDEQDPKVWSIAVVDAASPTLNTVEQLQQYIVATNIIPDVDKGPAWMPDSENIVYVKNNRKQYNPIELVNIKTRASTKLDTQTRINHDISVSRKGLIAFRSQVDQWDHIFIARLPDDIKTTDTP